MFEKFMDSFWVPGLCFGVWFIASLFMIWGFVYFDPEPFMK